MLTRNLLFNDGILSEFLEGRKRELFKEIQKQDANYILNVSITDFCDYFYNKSELDAPVLDEENITVDQQEKDIDVSKDYMRSIRDRSKPFYLKGTSISYFIPFSGDTDLFRYQPSSFTLNPAEAIIGRNELCVSFDGIDQDPEKVKRDFSRELGKIKKYLGWVAKDITQFNDNLAKEIETKVKHRREKLLKDRALVANLGFPLRKRKDAPLTYVVPEIRRKITAKPTASTALYKPEPALSMEDYEHILNVANNMALVMERSPNTFSSMKEEDIRQHFLVQLNGQYEGQATGETFNFQGKTDILIRHEGKNVFIAECKFWEGTKGLKDTINQILNYLSWRDTKTSIFIFNLGRSLSNVLSKIPDIVKNHPNFKRQLEYRSETGFRFILHHKDDKNRELYLTIMIFEVPK